MIKFTIYTMKFKLGYIRNEDKYIEYLNIGQDKV